MFRTKARIKAGACALLTVTGLVAINAACDEYFPVTACDKLSREKLYDGDWILESINGIRLPTNDPTDPSRRITAGQLTFATLTIQGSCDATRRSGGQVSGTVSYTQAGAPSNRKAGGTFYGFHARIPNGVELVSTEGSAKGTVEAPSIMTFANISDARFVLANKGTVTLVFRKFSF